MERGSDILAYTCSHGSRDFLSASVPALRGTAGVWFDWSVYLGNPSDALRADAESLLHDERRLGIQHLTVWPENRGQHWATSAALRMARELGYPWLLRLDDDITPKTQRWLKKMLARLEKLKEITGDKYHRLVCGPRIMGLNNPIPAQGVIEKQQGFPVEVVPVLGGACRLHPVSLLENYEPSLYAPIGRGDPQSIAAYLADTMGGMAVRFPDIRMRHPTDELEAQDGEDGALVRKMARYYPYLGAEA